MTEGLPILLLGGLFLLSVFFSAAETALFSLTRLERRRLLERRPHQGKLVNDLLDHPRRTLITILIGNNIVNICATAVVTLLALQFFGPAGVSPVIIFFTVFLIFVCEIVPKVFAVRNNETLAILAAPFLEIFSLIFLPVRRVVRLLSDWILSFLLLEKQETSDLISTQDLKVLIQIGEEEGIVGRKERRMIQKLFELGERPVRSIMTPRIDLKALRLGDPWERQIEMIKNYHFTHFPVYQDSLDQVIGVVSVQEVILSGERDLSKFLKPPLYVPELKRIDELLRDFQKTNEHFAVCVDEFGGTAGVVTLEDVLEEIFGEFHDEYAKESGESIRSLGKDEYLVNAKIPLAHFNEFFRSRLHSKEAETLNGFILEKMGRVPRKGEEFQLPPFTFRIQGMARQRILQVYVRIKR